MNLLTSPTPTITPWDKLPVAVWKRGLIVAAVSAVALFSALMVWGGFPWAVCLGWALAVFVLIPLRLRLGEKAALWLGRLCFVLYPFAGFCTVEFLSGLDPFATLSPLYLALNLAFYYLIALLLYLIAGRTKLSAEIGRAHV